MSDWWSLLDLACQAPQTGRQVARLPDGYCNHADFLEQVNGWQRAFDAQSVSSWALFLADPVVFAAALFGAWHAGKNVVLPGDDRPATLAALTSMGCGLAGDWPDGLQPATDDEAVAVRRPLDPAMATLTVFTSGSQGHAQAIDKKLSQLWSEVQALERAFASRLQRDGCAQPVVWATVSHQHIYGLLFLVLWPLAAGRAMGTQRLLYPEDMVQTLGTAPSVLVATPAHLKRLGAHLNWQDVRPALRAVFSSGGPLPFEVSCEAAGLLGCVPIEVFGSTETGGVAWRQPTQLDQAWQPFEDVHWRLDEGCLTINSPRLPDGAWWPTTDRAESVGQDSFRLLGRSDRIVKIEEKRVSLSAVERTLLSTPWVQDVRALVIPTLIGDRVGVVVVPTAGGHDRLIQGRHAFGQCLREALQASVDPVALPRRWRFVDMLPINAQGKTPESLLRDLFETTPSSVSAMPESPDITWLDRREDEALATLDIHAGLSVFQGHFPGASILPGVAQLDWTLGLGRDCFDLPAYFVRLEVLKFVSPVVPGTTLFVALQRKYKPTEPDLTVLQFRLYSQPSGADVVTEHASGRAVWRADEAGVHV